MKTLLSTTALILTLTALPALAQTTPAPAATTAAPAATTAAPTADMTPGSSPWYTPGSGDMRAWGLVGSAVHNTAGETIGEVNDVLLDKTGKVVAVVIGVGGFLGMGEHKVAVNFDSLRLTRDTSGANLITVNVTKETLKAAPAWMALPRT